VTVVEARGVDNDPVPPNVVIAQFSPTEDRTVQGVKVEYFASDDLSGEPHTTGLERFLIRRASPNIASAKRPAYGSFRWSGWFWPPQDGVYEFGLRSTGEALFRLDGAPVITAATPAKE